MSLARHTAYNLAGQLLPLALSLATLPLYLHHIGEARFGVLTLVWVFFGYAGLFDLGVGQALARELAALQNEAAAAKSALLVTALMAALAVGLVGAATALPLALLLFDRFGAIDPGLRPELVAALPLAAAIVPMAALSGVLNGGLQACKAFAEINIIAVSTQALFLLAPLGVALAFGPDLAGLVAAVALARLALLAALAWRCGRRYLTTGSLVPDLRWAGRLLRFGGWTTISTAVSPLLIVLDRFVIGAQLGAQAVSHYVVPFQLAERTTALASALGSALFPRFAANPAEAARRQLALEGMQALLAWTSAPIALSFMLVGPFLGWWISPAMAGQATAAAQILLFAFWVSGLAVVPYTKLLATGRPDLVALCHVIQLPPYLVLLFAGLAFWGLAGAAAAFAARVLIDFVILARGAVMLAATLKLLALPMALTSAALLVNASPALQEGWRWTAGAGLALALVVWSLPKLARSRSAFSGQDS